MTDNLSSLNQVLVQEANVQLDSILLYWATRMPDHINGGFWGSIDHNDITDPLAVKGLVLNARILWTFSQATIILNENRWRLVADRACNYLLNYFQDKEYGGMYWSLKYTGEVLDSRKQVYGLAFALYGLVAYYELTKKKEILSEAIALYELLELKAADKIHNGYWEGFSRKWEPLDNMRLSDKDDNEPKTTNTHLHILEAYAVLYKVWPNDALRKRLINLLDIFDTFIINKETGHLQLFFDEYWQSKSALISYGHDIEAAWLLQDAADILRDDLRIQRFKQYALQLTNAAIEGMDDDGGLWYEYDAAKDIFIYEKHWWPQAEALVGYLNAWQLTNEENWLFKTWQSWAYIKNKLVDEENGEWHWGRNEHNGIIPKEKAGFWKCPYHNGRACIEIIKRLKSS